jgi:pSer/pThr/pTyr-binding forkhead associated (FHA) protein
VPALVVKEGPAAGQRIGLSGETEIGRLSTDLFQEDSEVSRRHAVVRSGAEGVEIEDLGSSNGTWVNDERISGTRKLSNGDRVRIGQTTFEVELEEADRGTVIAGAPQTGPGVTSVAPTPAPAPPEPAQPAQATQPQPPVQPPPPAQAQPPAQPEPARPQAPFQPEQPAAQAPTAPQAPVQPSYGQPAAGQPGAAYAQPAGAYAQPSTGYQYGARPGARPGIVSAAGVLLIIAGVLTALWTIYDIVLLFGDFESARAFGFFDFLIILLVLDGVTLLGAALEIIGGIRVFSLRGRGLAITGVLLVILAWIAGIAYIFLEGFTVTSLAWIALAVTVGASVAALITLLAAGRHFSARR